MSADQVVCAQIYCMVARRCARQRAAGENLCDVRTRTRLLGAQNDAESSHLGIVLTARCATALGAVRKRRRRIFA